MHIVRGAMRHACVRKAQGEAPDLPVAGVPACDFNMLLLCVHMCVCACACAVHCSPSASRAFNNVICGYFSVECDLRERVRAQCYRHDWGDAGDTRLFACI